METRLRLAASADDQPTRGRDDSLVAALIEKLPAPGTVWPAAERQAWLDMMAIAFITLYGATAGIARPNSSISTKPSAGLKRSAARRPAPKAAKAKPPIGAGPEFYIDKQGFARRAGGDRVMAADVHEILVDLRGEKGDLATITWADDSTGVRGHSLDIQAG